MNSKKVVLLCYYFPPNTGVGGRRWLKLCKYLSEQNIEITVFTPKKFILKNQPSWENELVQIKNLKVIQVNDFYPKILLDKPITFFEKINYKISNVLVKIFTSANMYDPSAFWHSIIHKKIKKYLFDNNIENLIVSGIPFDYFYYASQLKSANKNLNLILDFRDLWTDSLGSFGKNVALFQSKKRYDKECFYENYSIQQANYIFCASQDLYEALAAKHPNQKNKFQLLLNGFDTKDIVNTTIQSHLKPTSNNKITIANIGTINCAKDYYLHFINALIKIKNDNPIVYANLEFTFYGNTNIEFENDIKNYRLDIVTFFEKIDNNKVKEVLHKADMVLYIKKEDELVNSFASKFFEYLCARKFILILSPKGEVTNYIEKNNIGLVLQKQTIYDDLITLFKNFTMGNIVFNSQLDISEFGYDVISKKVNAILQ